ncbi:MAG: hypothetical protein JRK53_08385 [Deltaproteobacteria bacterium]|nr:hypothetical protein [Deltaproteobacteria bacterium]
MSINETLTNIDNHTMFVYGCWQYEFDDFLRKGTDFDWRQQQAIRSIEGIMTAHKKQDLLHHIAELARIEHGIKEIEPWVRDHVVHALLSFILGMYINEYYLKIKADNNITSFQWKIAGLFHDVGYPIQVAKDIIKPYTDTFNRIKRELGVDRPDIQFRIVLIGIEELSNGKNSLELIQACFDKWDLAVDAKHEYRNMVLTGKICHGIISALSVLYIIDLMYQKYNPKRKYKKVIIERTDWNQTLFDDDIIPSCAAIYLHNLPSSKFENSKIDRLKSPLAFLLKLSDCLQEWERPSHDNQYGYSGDLFEIELKNDELLFYADIPNARKNKIRDEIYETLIAPDIKII